MNRALIFIAATLTACPGGVLFDRGAAFPCNFADGPGKRDQGCPTDWICTSGDVCQKKDPAELIPAEAFESGHLPVFEPWKKIYPVDPYLGDAGTPWDVDATNAVRPTVVLLGDEGKVRIFNGPLPSDAPVVPNLGTLTRPMAVAVLGPDFRWSGFLHDATTYSVFNRTGFRGVSDEPFRLRSLFRPGANASVGLLIQCNNGDLRPIQLDALNAPLPIQVGDAQLAFSAAFGPDPVYVALAKTGTAGRFDLQSADLFSAGTAVLNAETAQPISINSEGPVLLRHSADEKAWVAWHTSANPDGGQQGSDVLTGWFATTPELPNAKMFQRWSCRPCDDGKLVAFSTQNAGGTASAEVVCENTNKRRSVAAISDANGGRCVATAAFASIPLGTLVGRTLDNCADDVGAGPGSGGQLRIRGTNGERWFGSDLSRLRPVAVDRAPSSIGQWQGDLFAYGHNSIASLTSGGVLADLGEEDSFYSPAAIGHADGWFISGSGHLMHLGGGGGGRVRLLGPFGGTANGPYAGDADADGNMVLSASDSIYFFDRNEAPTTLSPLLAPDPNFPIKYITVTAPDKDADADYAGFVLTTRSLFRISYEGTPRRWVSKQVVLNAGPAIGLWAAGPGLPFARVGYENGEVFSLPSGQPLTETLPAGQTVVDYATLSVWPVALTTEGIFVAKKYKDNVVGGVLAWEPIPNVPAKYEGGKLGKGIRDGGREILFAVDAHGVTHEIAQCCDPGAVADLPDPPRSGCESTPVQSLIPVVVMVAFFLVRARRRSASRI